MNAQVTLPELQRRMVATGHALHARGWVANLEGNATALTADGRLLATSGATSLGDLREGDLLLLDRFGRRLSGSGDAFPELSMHLAVYRGRSDVGAVVHAHPPVATAFAAAGLPIEARFLPEFVVEIGGVVPVVPFAMPGSEALSGALAPFLEPYDAVLLANHGVLAWGPDLATALRRVEHVEAAATIAVKPACWAAPSPFPTRWSSCCWTPARPPASVRPAAPAPPPARGADLSSGNCSYLWFSTYFVWQGRLPQTSVIG